MTDTDTPAEPAPAPEAPPVGKRRRWRLILLAVVAAPVLLLALYTVVVLSWAYSEGDRSGVLYKLSRKGWICKTWEGELNLAPEAATPTIWHFTVRDGEVARRLNEAMGSRVAIHYSEHLGVPTTCFGDTRYFVDGFRIIQ